MLVTVALTAAWDRRELGAGEAWLRLAAGAEVAVAVGGGPFAPVSDDQRLGPGDRVYVTAGRADLEMARDVGIELRAESDVIVKSAPVLHGGSALVQTDSVGVRVTTMSGASVAVAPGSIARLSRTLTYGAAVYRGEVVVESAGRRVGVPSLRQAYVSGTGGVPDDALPILLDDADTWDRRYLGPAFELTRQLDAVSQGFSTNVVVSARPLDAVLLEAIPSAVPSPELTALSSGRRRPGEVLVGTAIATLAGSPLGSVFDFRDRGAAWGLVVLDQQIEDGGDLFGLLRLALADAPVVATHIAAPVPPGGTGEVAGPAWPDTGTSSDSPTGSGSTPSPPDDPLAPPTGTPLDPAIDDTTDTLTGTVEETEEIVTEEVTTVIETVDDTAGTTTGDTTDPLSEEVDDTTDTLLSP